MEQRNFKCRMCGACCRIKDGIVRVSDAGIARIAVLTNLLGGVPAWNCKSGKDRTGMMDVECKFLATLAALGKDIPEPGAQLNAEQKMLYRNLLLQSGNHEMQKYNTGVAGYKLEGVGSITERIGDIASKRMFLGASKIVHS